MQSQYFFLHFRAEAHNHFPVILDGLCEICIAVPVFLLPDLIDGKLQHLALGLNGPDIIEKEADVVGQFLFRPKLAKNYYEIPTNFPFFLKSVTYTPGAICSSWCDIKIFQNGQSLYTLAREAAKPIKKKKHYRLFARGRTYCCIAFAA